MIKAFSTNPLFTGLSDEHLEELSRLSKSRAYAKNTIVVSQGDVSDTLYVIVEGRVSVFLDDGKGKEVTLNTLGVGESFGELAPLGKIPRVASIKTLEQTTLALISKEAFFDCIAKTPSISMRIIELLVDRIQDLTEEVSSLALLDVYGRVSRVLKKNSTEINGKDVIDDLTQQDIAKRVGASREMVNRIFKELKAGGYITLDGHQITIEKKLPSGW